MADDIQVIRRVLGGEVEAFRALVERYQGQLFGFIRGLVRRPEEAEDVAQEVFLAAFTHLRAFDPDQATFPTWLLTIARNKCLNALKKRRPIVLDELPEGADGRTPDREAAEQEWFRRLDRGLEALPPEQKTVFVLAELQGLSYEEVRRIEGVSLGTVKSRLSRAKERLRSFFRDTAEQP
jgi:RNA polymerase sigma-70 factor (ECF subfamily)